jgi:hypothetical protein
MTSLTDSTGRIQRMTDLNPTTFAPLEMTLRVNTQPNLALINLTLYYLT